MKLELSCDYHDYESEKGQEFGCLQRALQVKPDHFENLYLFGGERGEAGEEGG